MGIDRCPAEMACLRMDHPATSAWSLCNRWEVNDLFIDTDFLGGEHVLGQRGPRRRRAPRG